MEDPKKTWEKIKADAKDDPVKLKTSIFEFMGEHARNPDAISIMPEVLKTATHLQLSRDERTKIATAATASQNLLLPRFELPAKGKRPDVALNMNPYEKRIMDIYTPLNPSHNIEGFVMARDTMMHIKKVKNDER